MGKTFDNMEIAIFIDVPVIFREKAKYVIKNLFTICDASFIVFDNLENFSQYKKKILYSSNIDKLEEKILSDQSTIFISLDTRTLDYFQTFREYNSNNVLYINEVPCIFPYESGAEKLFPFDIFAASFFFLSCWQEYCIKEKDNWGRVPLNKTLSCKLNIHGIPIVNEYLNIFRSYIKKEWQEELELKKIDGNKCIAILSHDIDHINWSSIDYLRRLVKERKKLCYDKNLIPDTVHNIGNKIGIFNQIKEIESKYDYSSTSFFLSNYPEEYEHSIPSLINLLSDKPFEVGHHLSEKSINDHILNNDRRLFEKYYTDFTGERVHTLRFFVNDLFTQLEKNSYKYDCSLLFPEDLGYRTGFTYPHRVFDPYENREFGVLEIAPNIMETTVFERKYRNLNEDDGEKNIYNFIIKNYEKGGIISILFHHSFFWINYSKRINLYENVLKLLESLKVKSSTYLSVYQWYIKQKNVKL